MNEMYETMKKISLLEEKYERSRLGWNSLCIGFLFAVITGNGPGVADAQSEEDLLPATEAAAKAKVPEGFRVSLFASEPDVKQPIGFCIDDRGRLWVAEAYNYPQHGTRPGDRIIILEDEDHDGKFDRRTVFYDQLNYVTGIEVGFGGAWVMSPPYFYFIPDRDKDDIPDSQPQVLLDGFGNHANSHNLANGFAWGPDGWLYGTHGRTNWSKIGKPGTPDEQRITYDGGVYRYHPIRHVWEPYSDGTTNPWGIDWNDFGEAFICNCVNPHLFHVLPGAHYEPWRNRTSSQYAYQRIDTIADHLHFVGTGNVRDGIGSDAEDSAGGGHAHCGTMVYLGDNWPDKYRNSVFMNNIHGKRINHDWLRRSGSGYVASHAPDVFRSRDPWFVGVTLQYGPDGGVYVLDWSDIGECHYVKNTRKETGRIFKITYQQPNRPLGDVSGMNNAELVQLQLHRNEWYVRHSRKVLQERFARGEEMSEVRHELMSLYRNQTEITRRLRGLWALWSIEGLDENFLMAQLDDPSEYIRSWAIRLLAERWISNQEEGRRRLGRLKELALTESSPLVRLYLAAILQRIPVEFRWELALALSGHAEDANDHNIPLMLWYGVEPLIDVDLSRFVRLAAESKIPLLRTHIARRIASHPNASEGIEKLIEVMKGRHTPAFQQELLDGLLTGLKGVRSKSMPKNWEAAFTTLFASEDESVRQASLELALIFDDPKAISEMRNRALDPDLDLEVRRKAIQSLVEKKAIDTSPLLFKLLGSTAMQRVAIQGLAEFNDPATPHELLSRYASFPTEAQQDVLQTLASRPEWALELLKELESSRIPRLDVSAFTVRQLLSLDHAEIDSKIRESWGEFRATPEETARRIVALKKQLTALAMEKADLENGRALFQKQCATCHRFFGEGGTVGPDITGSQRTNIDYLLENLIDPSAAVAKDYRMEIFLLEGGRTVTGIVVEESQQALIVQTANEKMTIPKIDIEGRKQSGASLMPDGILNSLSKSQIINLLGYLMSPSQIPLPAASEGSPP